MLVLLLLVLFCDGLRSLRAGTIANTSSFERLTTPESFRDDDALDTISSPMGTHVMEGSGDAAENC